MLSKLVLFTERERPNYSFRDKLSEVANVMICFQVSICSLFYQEGQCFCIKTLSMEKSSISLARFKVFAFGAVVCKENESNLQHKGNS